MDTTKPKDEVLNPLNHATLSGKVDHIDTHEGVHYTRMTLPAADEYDRPQHVQIRSDRRIAQIGEIALIKVKIGGWNRRFQRKDNGGEGTQTTIVLEAV